MHTAGNTFDNIAHKLIDEQMASDINHLLELVEAGTIATLKHIDRTDNPHKVTKEQVGLGNVDNTSDADKPVSNATQSALNTLKAETISAINTLKAETMSAINTFKAENKAEHNKINSAINTFKTENKVEHSKINSAINTFKEENRAEHLDLVSAVFTIRAEIGSAINTFEEKNRVEHNKINSAINTFKEENKAEHNKINSAINTLKEENKVEHSKINSAINTLKVETTSAINTFKEENKVEHSKINSAINTLKVETTSAINTFAIELTFGNKPKKSITAVKTFCVYDTSSKMAQMDKSELYRLPEIRQDSLDALTTEGNYFLFVEYRTALANKLDSLIGYGFTGIQGAFKLEVSRALSAGPYDYMQKLTTTIPSMPFVFFRTRKPASSDAFGGSTPAKWSDWQKATSNMMTVANAGTVNQAVNVLSYTAQGDPVTVPLNDVVANSHTHDNYFDKTKDVLSPKYYTTPSGMWTETKLNNGKILLEGWGITLTGKAEEEKIIDLPKTCIKISPLPDLPEQDDYGVVVATIGRHPSGLGGSAMVQASCYQNNAFSLRIAGNTPGSPLNISWYFRGIVA